MNGNAAPTEGCSPLTEGAPLAPRREIRYEHSLNLSSILDRFGVSLLVSTYQAGKLGVIGSNGERLTFAFHNFERSNGRGGG